MAGYYNILWTAVQFPCLVTSLFFYNFVTYIAVFLHHNLQPQIPVRDLLWPVVLLYTRDRKHHLRGTAVLAGYLRIFRWHFNFELFNMGKLGMYCKTDSMLGCWMSYFHFAG